MLFRSSAPRPRLQGGKNPFEFYAEQKEAAKVRGPANPFSIERFLPPCNRGIFMLSFASL